MFFDENGTAFTADGKPLTQEELENITQKPSAISWEEYCQIRDREYRLMQIDSRLMDMANQIEDLENEGYSEENQAILDGIDNEVEQILKETRSDYDAKEELEVQKIAPQSLPNLSFN